MIKVARVPQAKVLTVEISGTIEEGVDLETLIGPVDQELTVNCKGLNRINSLGIKIWMTTFQKLNARGVKLRFIEVSSTFMDVFNMISNFNCGGEVVSVMLPYTCVACGKDLVKNCTVAELKASQFAIPSVTCDQQNPCKAQFDGVPDEFFNCLQSN